MQLILAAVLLIVVAGTASGVDVADETALCIESDREIAFVDYTFTGSSIEDTAGEITIVYYDPTISEDWPSIRGNFTAKDFNVSVNWSAVEAARTNDVFIWGHRVPEWGEAAAVWILNLIY